MPKHRSLTLKKFISAINPDMVERYFVDRVPKGQLPTDFAGIEMHHELHETSVGGSADSK